MLHSVEVTRAVVDALLEGRAPIRRCLLGP